MRRVQRASLVWRAAGTRMRRTAASPVASSLLTASRAMKCQIIVLDSFLCVLHLFQSTVAVELPTGSGCRWLSFECRSAHSRRRCEARSSCLAAGCSKVVRACVSCSCSCSDSDWSVGISELQLRFVEPCVHVSPLSFGHAVLTPLHLCRAARPARPRRPPRVLALPPPQRMGRRRRRSTTWCLC